MVCLCCWQICLMILWLKRLGWFLILWIPIQKFLSWSGPFCNCEPFLTKLPFFICSSYFFSKSVESVRKYLDSVRCCQSLEEVQKLSDNGDHEKVVDLLLDSFNLNKDLNIGQVERQEQIILLQKSLHSLKDYKVWESLTGAFIIIIIISLTSIFFQDKSRYGRLLPNSIR